MHVPAAMAHARTPIGASFTFSFLNSLGTGVVTTGIYFITRHFYGFSPAENYALGVVQGVAYVGGAMLAGRVVRAIGRLPGWTSRRILLSLMVLMAGLCALPQTAIWLAGDGAGGRPSAWPVWVTVTLYSPLTGVLWPLVESYVSGGRRGEHLRDTVGWWNVSWSSALAVAYFGVSPFVERDAPLAVMLLGGVHLCSAASLAWFGPEPGAHPHDKPHAVPEVYPRLLVTFRMLLPTSYLLLTAFLPYLPSAMDKLAVPAAAQAMLNGGWLVPRTAMFVVLQRWTGWHGRWWPPIASACLLLGGFAGLVLAGETVGGGAGIVLLMISMGAFGVGMAVVYCGAIYYAMAVGDAAVDAGGAHEALIGLGYTVGPAIGLGAALAVRGGALPDRAFELTVLTAVAVISVAGASMVVRRVARHSGRTG